MLPIMKSIKILYGKGCSSYTYAGPYCNNCVVNKLFHTKSTDRESNKKCIICSDKGTFYEVCSTTHQICFSNDFKGNWMKIGNWYMGCVFLRSDKFSMLTRETMGELFNQGELTFGKNIEGYTSQELISKIEFRIENLIKFLKDKISNIIGQNMDLIDICWEWGENAPELKKFNLL